MIFLKLGISGRKGITCAKDLRWERPQNPKAWIKGSNWYNILWEGDFRKLSCSLNVLRERNSNYFPIFFFNLGKIAGVQDNLTQKEINILKN